MTHFTGLRIFFLCTILSLLTTNLFAGSTAILSSGRADEEAIWNTARNLTVDVYRNYEVSKGNTVTNIRDYHVPKGVETLYIIAHGWIREDGDAKGFVYTDDANTEHWMAWMSYLAYLDRYTDVKTLVVNSCMAGASVDAAKLLSVGFDVYASCGADEVEKALLCRPLPYAVAYTSGEIPEEIAILDNVTHPESFKSKRLALRGVL